MKRVSVLANSSFMKTDIEDLSSSEGSDYRRKLVKGVEKFAAIDTYMARRYDRMTNKERHGLAKIVKQKEEKRLKR